MSFELINSLLSAHNKPNPPNPPFDKKKAFYKAASLLNIRNLQATSNFLASKKPTAIGEATFFGNALLTNLPFLTSEVITIANSAFEGTPNLGSIAFPKAKTIGDSAFKNTPNTIPSFTNNFLSSIGSYAFYNSGINSELVQNAISSLLEYTFAFSNIKAFASSSLTELKNAVFLNASALSSFSGSNNISQDNSVGQQFMHCSALANINIQAFNNITTENFKYCRSLVSVSFKEGLTHLNKEAFSDCSNLTSVEFPDSLKSFGSNPNANSVQWFMYTFMGSKISQVTIPQSIIEYGLAHNCFGHLGISEFKVHVPESLTLSILRFQEVPIYHGNRSKENPAIITLSGKIDICSFDGSSFWVWTKLNLIGGNVLHGDWHYHPNNYFYNPTTKMAGLIFPDFKGYADDIEIVYHGRNNPGLISIANFKFPDSVHTLSADYSGANIFDRSAVRSIDFNNIPNFNANYFGWTGDCHQFNFKGKKLLFEMEPGLIYNLDKTRVISYLTDSYYYDNVDIEFPIERDVFPDATIGIYRRNVIHNGLWHTRWIFSRRSHMQNAGEIAKLTLRYDSSYYDFEDDTFLRFWQGNTNILTFEDKFKTLFTDQNKDALFFPNWFSVTGRSDEADAVLDFSWANFVQFGNQRFTADHIKFSNKLRVFHAGGEVDRRITFDNKFFNIETTNKLNIKRIAYSSFPSDVVLFKAPEIKLLSYWNENNLFIGNQISRLHLNCLLDSMEDKNFVFDSEALHLIIDELKPGSKLGQITYANANNLTVIRLGGATTPWQEKGVAVSNIIDANKLLTLNGVQYAITNSEAIVYNYDRKTNPTTINIPAQVEGKPVTKVLNYAFDYHPNIEKITFPSSVNVFGKGLFRGSNVSMVNFNSPVSNIDAEFFSTYQNLKELILPAGLNNFELASNLSHGQLENISAGNNTAKYRFKFNTIIDRATNEIVLGAKNGKIEFGILGIQQQAFKNTKIQTLTFPSTVKWISDHAFEGSQLQGTITLNEGLEVIEDYVFAELPNEVTLILPTTIKSIGTHAFQNANKLTLKFRGSMPTNQDFLTYYSGPTPEVNYQG